MKGFALTFVTTNSKETRVLVQKTGQFCIYASYGEAAYKLGVIIPRLNKKDWPEGVIRSMRVTEIDLSKGLVL